MTLASWIPVVRPFLDQALVSSSSLELIDSVARHLPSEGPGILEARLAPASLRVDLSVRLDEPTIASRVAARCCSLHVRSFIERWARQKSDLSHISSVWLEFDLERRETKSDAFSPLEPVVCARLDSGWRPEWLIGTLLPALQGSALRPSQCRLILRALDRIPDSAKVLYAFGLRPRSESEVRLELFGLPPSAMSRFLAPLAPAETLRQLVEVVRLVADGERFHLSFDVGDQISPRVGVECGFVRLPHREPGWDRILDRLVATGLCAAEKREALRAWPGTDSLRTAADRWPREGIGAGGHCVRCLSHLKVVCQPPALPEAKVYLLFQHLRPGQEPGR